MKVEIGYRVRLYVPENPILHGAVGVVRKLEEWGYVVSTQASRTGYYRAWKDEVVCPVTAWEERVKLELENGSPQLSTAVNGAITNAGEPETVQHTPIDLNVGTRYSASSSSDIGYTGNACSNCGSFRMRRNGSCELCDDCGTTSGCS